MYCTHYYSQRCKRRRVISIIAHPESDANTDDPLFVKTKFKGENCTPPVTIVENRKFNLKCFTKKLTYTVILFRNIRELQNKQHARTTGFRQPIKLVSVQHCGKTILISINVVILYTSAETDARGFRSPNSWFAPRCLHDRHPMREVMRNTAGRSDYAIRSGRTYVSTNAFAARCETNSRIITMMIARPINRRAFAARHLAATCSFATCKLGLRS